MRRKLWEGRVCGEDQEFGYGRVKFEIPIGHPSGGAKYEVESIILGIII